MTNPEGNNKWTRNLYGEGRIVQEQFNNEWSSVGKPGIQAAIREILHSRETASILISGVSNLTPSGTYNSCDVGPGYILTKNGDGLSRMVPVTGVTGLNIDAVSKCIVASNDGTSSVKAKTAVLSTDVIIACRGTWDNAVVDVRNLKTEDDVLSMNVGGNMRVEGTLNPYLTTPYKVGVDDAGNRVIVVKNGDTISGAITALGGAGTIVLLPGTYTENITLSSAIQIIGIDRNLSNVVGNITISAAGCKLVSINVTGQVSIGEIDIIIQDCYISHTAAAIVEAITSSKTGYIRIINSIVTSSGNDVYCINISPTADGGITLTIDGCKVVGTGTGGTYGTQGIYTDYIQDVHVTNCHVTAKTNGIVTTCITATIANCRVYVVGIDATDSAIDANASTTSVIGCFVKVTGTIFTGIKTLSSAIVSSCTVIGGTFDAACIGVGAYSIVEGCQMSATSAARGIYVGGGTSNTMVTGNRINETTTTGIDLPAATCAAVGNSITASTCVSGGKKHANLENGTYTHGDTS